MATVALPRRRPSLRPGNVRCAELPSKAKTKDVHVAGAGGIKLWILLGPHQCIPALLRLRTEHSLEQLLLNGQVGSGMPSLRSNLLRRSKPPSPLPPGSALDPKAPALPAQEATAASPFVDPRLALATSPFAVLSPSYFAPTGPSTAAPWPPPTAARNFHIASKSLKKNVILLHGNLSSYWCFSLNFNLR